MVRGNGLTSSNLDRASGDSVSEELAAAWEAEPRCAECGELVRSAFDAALLVGPNRVTHKERCFIPALIRGNPQLKLLTTRRSAKEGPAQQRASHDPARESAPEVRGETDE